jgi:hypothetical protein
MNAWRNLAMRLFFIFLAMFMVLPGLSGAEPFSVSNLKVELPSGPLEARRNTALQQATEAGITQLLRQLTPQSTWHLHEDVRTRFNENTVVSGVQIKDEEMKRAYTATFDITYNGDEIRQVLTQMGIPFSEVEPVSAIVVPILILPEHQLLWSEVNPWLKAFRTVIDKSEHMLVQPVLPIGDASEMALLSPEQAIAQERERILTLAGQYNANAAIIAVVTTERRGFRQYISVTGSWMGPREVQPVGFSMPIDQGDSFDSTLEAAAERLLASFATRWRNDHLIRVDRPGRVYVRYQAKDATDLMRLRLQLKKISSVRDVTTKLLSLERAVLQIDFYGQPTDLQNKMMDQGYRVTQEGGLWVLTPVSHIQ